jgi:hypothetical protein
MGGAGPVWERGASYSNEDTTVTQASLSPDLPSSVGLRPVGGERPGIGSEAALWLFGLTSVTLVLASLLLLALLAQDVVADGPLSGFVSATAVAIATIGVAALVYVIATAKRNGYIGAGSVATPDPSLEVPAGMHIVPATPADPAARQRRQRAEEKAARDRQAKAIAAVESERRAAAMRPTETVTTPAPPKTAPRPPTQPAPAPARAPLEAAAPVRPQTAAPVRPPSATPPRTTATVPTQASAVAPTLPRPQRPTPARVFPRMPAPVVRPRTQVAGSQLVAADIRMRSTATAVRPPLARAPLTRPPVTRPSGPRPDPVRP